MATPSRRLEPEVLADDESAFNNLLSISNYQPANPAFALDNGRTAKADYDTTRAAEDVAKKAYEAARDAAAAAERVFHDFIVGARVQVEAQFGHSSDQLQSVGLKKKSEYKKPGGRKKTG
jgi:hypothetical protein